jgi:hypothetical protein
MLTRKQTLERKRQKAQEAAKIEKLLKDLGRTDAGRVKAKRKERDLVVEHRDQPANQYASAPPIEIVEKDSIFFEEGYEEREAVAQREIARKKKRVGVLVNKSGYQYISEETDLTTLGKK